MFIKSINWIDKEIQEAEVIVSDGLIEILCFSHPFNKSVKDKLSEPIYCIGVENIVISDKQSVQAIKNNESFGYSLRGKFIDKFNKKVLLGNIELCMEDVHIPADIPEFSYIEFDVDRLSIY